MTNKIKKFLSIYIVTGLIGGFSLLYMLSFALVLSDVNKGSSVEINRAMIQKSKEVK